MNSGKRHVKIKREVTKQPREGGTGEIKKARFQESKKEMPQQGLRLPSLRQFLGVHHTEDTDSFRAARAEMGSQLWWAEQAGGRELLFPEVWFPMKRQKHSCNQ